jgi:hypothetical protein
MGCSLQFAVTGKIDEPCIIFPQWGKLWIWNDASKLSREDCGMIPKFSTIYNTVHPNLMAKQENQLSGIHNTHANFGMQPIG